MNDSIGGCNCGMGLSAHTHDRSSYAAEEEDEATSWLHEYIDKDRVRGLNEEVRFRVGTRCGKMRERDAPKRVTRPAQKQF